MSSWGIGLTTYLTWARPPEAEKRAFPFNIHGFRFKLYQFMLLCKWLTFLRFSFSSRANLQKQPFPLPKPNQETHRHGSSGVVVTWVEATLLAALPSVYVSMRLSHFYHHCPQGEGHLRLAVLLWPGGGYNLLSLFRTTEADGILSSITIQGNRGLGHLEGSLSAGSFDGAPLWNKARN